MTYHQKSLRSRSFLIPLCIFTCSIALRILTAEYLDIGGDNAAKWMWAKYIVEGVPFDHWYQQTVRWPILYPLAGLIKLFGYNPVLTYVMPLLFSSLATMMIYLIGTRLHGRTLGLCAAALTMLFPQMAQTGSQLWPGVFELGYLSLCLWLILCWIDSRTPWMLPLAAAIFFLGWGARVSMVYAYPGLVLLIFLPTRDFKAAFRFSAIIGILCGMEWLAFWLIQGNPMGRIGIISNTHLITAHLDITWTDYLLNIRKLTKLRGLLPIWVLCFIAALWIVTSSDKRWCAVGWLYVIHSLLLLYMPAGFSPLKLALPVGVRYWGVIAPFGLLCLAYALLTFRVTFSKTGKTLLVILFLAFTFFTLKKIPAHNALLQTNRDYKLLKPILASGAPVLMEYQHWQPNFIEEYVIALFTGKKGKRIPREDHVTVAIARNHDRMASLFHDHVTDIKSALDNSRISRKEYTVYLFTPLGCAVDTPPGAKIFFGRKHHYAIPLPQ